MLSRSTRRRHDLSRMLLFVGLPLLAVGLYGVAVGLITLGWPRTQAVILDARVDVRETTSTVPGTDKYRGGRTETRETASFHVRYRYRVDGQDYEADGVEPGDLGLQNSAASRDHGRTYKTGTQVMVAYDPRNPARAYLLPGPSSPSLMLALVGDALVLAGTWAARL